MHFSLASSLTATLSGLWLITCFCRRILLRVTHAWTLVMQLGYYCIALYSSPWRDEGNLWLVCQLFQSVFLLYSVKWQSRRTLVVRINFWKVCLNRVPWFSTARLIFEKLSSRGENLIRASLQSGYLLYIQYGTFKRRKMCYREGPRC